MTCAQSWARARATARAFQNQARSARSTLTRRLKFWERALRALEQREPVGRPHHALPPSSAGDRLTGKRNARAGRFGGSRSGRRSCVVPLPDERRARE